MTMQVWILRLAFGLAFWSAMLMPLLWRAMP